MILSNRKLFKLDKTLNYCMSGRRKNKRGLFKDSYPYRNQGCRSKVGLKIRGIDIC